MDQAPFTACALIVAGGVGSRATPPHLTSTPPHTTPHTLTPKQFQILGDKPVIAWSIDAFEKHANFIATIIVCEDSYRAEISSMIAPRTVLFAPAGKTRTASVKSGLTRAREVGADFIFIHDAARPGVDSETLDRLFLALAHGADGATPTRPVADALWRSSHEELDTIEDRTGLLRVQTPQAFVSHKIIAAYDELPLEDELADDVAVARRAGLRVVGVAGKEQLDKITWPQDFARMSQLLLPPMLPRIGNGFDAHRFGVGEFVTLCGLQISHSHGLAGHSDADVAWHALADALYGALSAGDIGYYFPPSEKKWRGAPSSIFLKHAGSMVRASGGVINHVDITIICEAPKIGPHRAAMAIATAQTLDLRIDQVSIKATTTEGMGYTGRREGIAALTSATILLPVSYRAATLVEPSL